MVEGRSVVAGYHVSDAAAEDGGSAGIALLLAAMSANGVSQIDNIEQIDRGYEDIEARLNALGANITRK